MKTVAKTDEGLRQFLSKHRIETLNLAGILENEDKLDVFVNEGPVVEGVLVKAHRFWYLHTESEAFLEELFQEMETQVAFYQFSGVWKPLADRIKARFQLVWDAPCELYVLPEDHPVPARPGSRARSVDLADAEVIDAHYTYRYPGSLEKIRKCIHHRNSSAIYVDGEIVCWLLVHEDNSLGIMYTLEAHRRKGLALEVSLDLVAKQRAAGITPFLQIRDDNAMSPDLARKSGFVPHGKCDWFGVMHGIPKGLMEGAAQLRKQALVRAGLASREEGGLCVVPGGGAGFVMGTPVHPAAVAQAEQLLKDQGVARGIWLVTPLDAPESAEVLEASGLERAEAWVCLGRFLVNIHPDPLDPEAVVEMPEAAWLDAAARVYDRQDLVRAIQKQGQPLFLVGNAQGVAGLLQQPDDDGFEVLWCTCLDASFLQRMLACAAGLKLYFPVVHVPEPQVSAFEQVGFQRIYPETRYRFR